MEKKINGIIFKKSSNPKKKYDAFLPSGKKISFGARDYEQYYDKIGMYSGKNHNDENRKRLYYARHGKEAEKYTPKWFSHHYLC